MYSCFNRLAGNLLIVLSNASIVFACKSDDLHSLKTRKKLNNQYFEHSTMKIYHENGRLYR